MNPAFVFFPGASWLHRLDGRVKFPLFILIAAVFGQTSWAAGSVAVLLCILFYKIAGIPLRQTGRTLWNFWPILILMLVSRWVSSGLEPALLELLRFSLIITVAQLLTYTTPAAAYRLFLGWLLGKLGLKRIAAIAGLLCSLFFRLLPDISLLLSETRTILQARHLQASRRPLRYAIAFASCVIRGIARRADSLTLALEMRRTNLEKVPHCEPIPAGQGLILVPACSALALLLLF